MGQQIKYVIVGYAGHAFVLCDAIKESGGSIEGYCDFEPKSINPFDLPYLGSEDQADLSKAAVVLGIGDNFIREKVYRKLESQVVFGRTIHPRASISETAILGKAVAVNAGSIINSLARIGNGAIVNTGAIIEHECCLGDFVHVAPGTVLAGNVKIGKLTFIGANAVVKQGVSIGKNVVVGAGAVVLKDIPDNATVVGNPARIIKIEK